MKKLSLVLIAIFCLALAGCSKDGEINAFMSEFDAATNEVSAKLEAGDVDGAQKAFDAKKASLKSKWEEVKTARGFQVSKETQTKMEEGTKKNMTTLTNASVKAVQTKPADSGKVQALVKEFTGIFQM
jgi:hypothetical protein